jgi:hypothetical protein
MALCSALAFLARGYSVGEEDQNLYLPFILQWNDPSLFPHDHLLQLGFARESLVWVGIAQLAKWIPLTSVLFVLWIAAAYAGLTLAFQIAAAWWRSAVAGWFAVLLWIPAYAVPGVANTTFDGYLTTRVIGTACALWALYGLFRRRWAVLASGLFAGALFHVITVLPLAVGMMLACAWHRCWKLLGASAASLGLGILVLGGYSSLYGRHELLARYSGEWLETVQRVDHELFPQLWTGRSWASLLVYVALFALLSSLEAVRRTEPGRTAILVVIGILSAALLGTLGIWADIALVVQFCLWRGQLFLLFLLAVLMAGLASRAMEDARILTAFAVALALLLWAQDDLYLRVLATGLLLACLYRDALLNLLRWVRQSAHRRRQTILLAGGLATVLLFLGHWFNWDLVFWLPPARVTVALLLAATVLAVFRWAALRTGRWNWERWAPAALLIVLLLAPSEMMVDWIREHRVLRRVYGPALATRMVHLARQAREKEERKAAAQMITRSVPKDATVVVPPAWASFRLDSLRSPFVTLKDGAPAEFSASYANLWMTRCVEIGAIRPEREKPPEEFDPGLSGETLKALSQRYRAIRLDYLVAKRDFDLSVVSEAGPYKLYRLAEP